MPNHFQFAKYSGCGNDFILIDNRSQHFPPKGRALIPVLCHRRKGIGADGVILLELSDIADCRMRIFNADGSEAEMCANGVRCLALFFRELGFPKRRFMLETMHRLMHVEIQAGGVVDVELGDPSHIQWNVEVSALDQTHQVQLLDTGVPHMVLFTEDIDRVDMVDLAPTLRQRRDLAPKGSNVNYAMFDISSKQLHVRTFERGVEGETLACGTGAAASAIAASRVLNLDSPIFVRVRSGDVLKIDFDWSNQQPVNLSISGEAKKVFQGDCDLSLLNGSDLLQYTLGIRECIG